VAVDGVSMLYVGTDRRVAVVDADAGTVLEAFVPPAGDDDDAAGVECVAASRERPARAFAGTFGDGLYRTTDGGASWSRVPLGPAADGASAAQVTAVAVAPWDPDVVFAGTEPSRVYRSTDGGESFAHLPGLTALPSSDEWAFPPRPHTHHVRWLAPLPGRPGRVLVAVEAGALVVLDVDDGTASFRERPPGARRDTHSMATHAEAVGRAYAAAGDGYAESDRAGEHWRHPQAGLEHRYCWSVAVDAGDPDVRLVSAASGARTAHAPSSAETYVYRKRGDAPFEPAMDGLPEPAGTTRPVLAAGADPGTFYAVSNRGLHETRDAGETWQAVDVDLPFSEGGATASALVAV